MQFAEDEHEIDDARKTTGDEFHYDNDDILQGPPGKQCLARCRNTNLMESVLEQLGWSNEKVSPAHNACTITDLQNGVTWKEWLKSAQKQALDDCEENIAMNTQVPETNSTKLVNKNVNTEPNVVKVVDKTYLQKSFKDKSADTELLKANIVTGLELNPSGN